MFGFHLACLLTKYLERTAGKPTAILYDPVTRSILGWSRDTRANPFDLGTAAVNLQRGCGARVSRCQILTSTPPEVVCLGMAVLTGVTDIIHFDGVNAVRYAPGNDLLSAPYRGPLEPEYPPKVGEWLNECSRFLTTRDVEGFETEFANVPAGSRMPSDIQNLIVGGETEPENVFPPRPAAAGGALLNGRNPAVDSFWMSLARRLVGAVHTGANLVAPGMRRGHNIGCILVDLNNRVLAWGVNTLNNNPTYHAETKCMWMFQRYYPGEQVPIGATLYTTLQSCLMCSATIKHACGDHAVRVVYADLDKTPPSVLTRGGGAREESLSSILRAEYSRLLAQHLLLARARWDRLRSAYKTDLFDRARRAPERAVIESDIRRIDALQDPKVKEVQDAAKALLIAAKQQRLISSVLGAMAAGAVGVSNGMPTALTDTEAEIRQKMTSTPVDLVNSVVKLFREAAPSFARRGIAKGAAIGNLQALRQRGLAIEAEARDLPYSGGAPVLLQNPVTFEKLYQLPVIERPNEVEVSTKILDLTTQIYGITLLIQVLTVVPAYNQH